MKSDNNNLAFSLSSPGDRSNLISPTTRPINSPQSPEGEKLNAALRRLIVCAFVFCLLPFNAFAQPGPAVAGINLAGKAVNVFEHETAPAIVLVFLRTDCPISNRYAPELLRLQRQFKNIRFWLVYPNDEAAAIEQHLTTYGFTRLQALRDPQQTLVKLARAQVTPEAAVFINGNLIYRGRIDDRVIAFGKQRPQPKQRELAATLTAVAQGTKLSFKEQPAVGCYIVKTDEK
jgi:hypothetical protein